MVIKRCTKKGMHMEEHNELRLDWAGERGEYELILSVGNDDTWFEVAMNAHEARDFIRAFKRQCYDIGDMVRADIKIEKLNLALDREFEE